MRRATDLSEAVQRLRSGERGPLVVVAPPPAECLWPIEETVFLPTDAMNKLEALATGKGQRMEVVAQQLLVDALASVTIMDGRRKVA